MRSGAGRVQLQPSAAPGSRSARERCVFLLWVYIFLLNVRVLRIRGALRCVLSTASIYVIFRTRGHYSWWDFVNVLGVTMLRARRANIVSFGGTFGSSYLPSYLLTYLVFCWQPDLSCSD